MKASEERMVINCGIWYYYCYLIIFTIVTVLDGGTFQGGTRLCNLIAISLLPQLLCKVQY